MATFCDCGDILNITKSISADVIDSSMKIIKIAEISRFIELVLKGEIESNKYIPLFQKKSLFNNNVYKKLKSEEKEKIIGAFNKSNVSTYDNPVKFLCGTCGSHKFLEDGTVISSRYIKKKKALTKDNVIYKRHDPTHPRTKDYICINKKCPSHDPKNKVKKEAVIIKDPETYQLTYYCTLCDKSWMFQ